ncbi:MAG: BlaI/MecI/CopY family transcriptional regulator [Gammaproteobacteria bacterium]|nr:BlaI/MecI/CopY family transcriptional regulator [Gammaproteobacteria bacterium]
MIRRRSVNPTEAELAILNVLWADGPSTVRHVHDKLQSSQNTGYTTVLKLLQIMFDKGLVQRDESERAHVYRTSSSRDATQGAILSDLVTRAFSGSRSALVMRALGESSKPEEIAEIRRFLDELERS